MYPAQPSKGCRHSPCTYTSARTPDAFVRRSTDSLIDDTAVGKHVLSPAASEPTAPVSRAQDPVTVPDEPGDRAPFDDASRLLDG